MGFTWSSPIKQTSRKRHLSDSVDYDDPPARKRIKGTSKYIYEHMFLNGESSDVEVHAAGKVWRLHKVYLKQSPFFKAMFDGQWSDSESNVIDLAYEDPNISIEALDVCLGSFYDGELRLTESNVSGVSAAATLLSLDEICCVCEDFMKINLECSSVLSYYSLACDYGLVSLKSSCLSWLRNNLMILPEKEKLSLLPRLEPQIIESLITSPEFFTYYSEYDIFLLLLKWIYVRQYGESVHDKKNLSESVLHYFLTIRKGEAPFLTTQLGRRYESVFSGLHFHDLFKYKEFASSVEDMNIFPTDKLLRGYRYLWLSNIHFDKPWVGSAIEPEEVAKPCVDDLFWQYCSRGGRVIKADERHSWRWPTFHFGVDLVFLYHKRRLSVTRGGRADSTDPTTSIPLIRVPYYRVMVAYRVFSLNSKGHITHCIQSDGVETISLGNDANQRLVQLTPEMTFPVFVQIHILMRTPPTDEVS